MSISVSGWLCGLSLVWCWGVQKGVVVKKQPYGLANLELAVPTPTETVFQLASTSKPFAGVGIQDRTLIPGYWSLLTQSSTSPVRQRRQLPVGRDIVPKGMATGRVDQAVGLFAEQAIAGLEQTSGAGVMVGL